MGKFKSFWKKNFRNKVVVVIICFFVIGMIGSLGGTPENGIDEKEPSKVIVNVIDLTEKTDAEIDLWCQESKVTCTKASSYSDEIQKGSIISQSVASGKKIYEGDKIEVIYSLGVKPPTEYLNALKKAESYSDLMHMSKAAIYDQLTSEYGEKFPAVAAQYAIDNLSADWNANALVKAEEYSSLMHMSKSSIYDQLTSEYGEQFLASEAQFAVDNLVADWNANALAKAKIYQSTMNMSKASIYDQLISEYGEKFTKEQAQYAIDNLGD